MRKRLKYLLLQNFYPFFTALTANYMVFVQKPDQIPAALPTNDTLHLG